MKDRKKPSLTAIALEQNYLDAIDELANFIEKQPFAQKTDKSKVIRRAIFDLYQNYCEKYPEFAATAKQYCPKEKKKEN
jgi:hypothetical protein